jgi:signal transduction histidine kinase
LLTYLYTCVLNNKKESFEEYPLQPSDKCYPEYRALQNCLNLYPDRSTTPPIDKPDKLIDKPGKPIDIPDKPTDYGITIEEMIKEQVEKLETALKSLNSKQEFFNSKSIELRNLMNSGNWLSSELKEQLTSAIETKQKILENYRTTITKITDELSNLKKNWNQLTFDAIKSEIQILEKDINSLNIQSKY